MKHLNLALAGLMAITITLMMMPAFCDDAKTAATDLTITISGFENSNGVAKVAIVNSKKNYSKDTPFKGYNFKIVNHKVVETLCLPYGEYAVKVFHDENSNGELDKRIFGIPAEAYGFSNDARGTIGPPEYEKTAFKLDSPQKEITITIK
ncbi:MAG: DUF2141 domain-containing protein [Desulfobacula sp.]|jgi:uncharacterized protein (DUF2141 family)